MRAVVSLFLVLLLSKASLAETTFILVENTKFTKDYSASVDTRLNYHLDKLEADAHGSITNFGGINGGACESSVVIDTTKSVQFLKRADELKRPTAYGEANILNAVRKAVSEAAGKPFQIVLISSGVDTCSGKEDAEFTCYKLLKILKSASNLANFKFEYVGSNEDAYACLNNFEPRAFSSIQNQYHFVMKGRTQEASLEEQWEQKNLFYILWFFVAIFLVFVVLFILVHAKIRYDQETDQLDLAKDDVKAQIKARKKKRLRGLYPIEWITLGVASLISVLFLSLRYFAVNDVYLHSIYSAIHLSNSRLGSAIVPTLLLSALGWIGMQLWQTRLNKMSLEFQAKHEDLKQKLEREIEDERNERKKNEKAAKYEKKRSKISEIVERITSSRDTELEQDKLRFETLVLDEGIENVEDLRSLVESAIETMDNLRGELVTKINARAEIEDDFELGKLGAANFSSHVQLLKKLKGIAMIDEATFYSLKLKFDLWKRMQIKHDVLIDKSNLDKIIDSQS